MPTEASNPTTAPRKYTNLSAKATTSFQLILQTIGQASMPSREKDLVRAQLKIIAEELSGSLSRNSLLSNELTSMEAKFRRHVAGTHTPQDRIERTGRPTAPYTKTPPSRALEPRHEVAQSPARAAAQTPTEPTAKPRKQRKGNDDPANAPAAQQPPRRTGGQRKSRP